MFSAASIGLSPGAVKFEGVLRSGYAEQTITLSTSSKEPLECSITASGPAAKWFSYSVGDHVVLNPRTHQSIVVMVQPPEDTPNGVYEGYITVVIKPNATIASGIGSQISSGVALKYSVEVSDIERKNLIIGGVSITNGATTEEKGSPAAMLEFSVNLRNDGNIKLTPKFHIDLLAEDKTTVLQSMEQADKQILPTTSQDRLITVPHNLTIGKYWAVFTASIDNQTIYETTLPFEVLERGALRVRGTLIKVSLNKIWVYTGEIVEINASFRNDGVVSTPVVFKGKAILDGSVESLIESDEMEAAPGETVELTSYYTPKKPGRYTITGRALFSKKQSPEKSSILNVRDIKEKPETETVSTVPETTNGTQGNNTVLYVIIALLAVLIVLMLWKSRKPKA